MALRCITIPFTRIGDDNVWGLALATGRFSPMTWSKRRLWKLDNGYYEIMEWMRIILVRLSYTAYQSGKVANLLLNVVLHPFGRGERTSTGNSIKVFCYNVCDGKKRGNWPLTPQGLVLYLLNKWCVGNRQICESSFFLPATVETLKNRLS